MFKKMAFVTALLFAISSMAYSGTVNLPQTGQTTIYFQGDDGDTMAGVAWPDPRFTDNGDGTVTDNLTGLIWLKDANCACSLVDSDGIDNGKMLWHAALDFVAGINDGSIQGCGSGYTDWRLPNINELESLVNAGEANSASWLNSQHFINVQGEKYWSSTTWITDVKGAWYVDIGSGSMWVQHKYWPETAAFVWPVRGVTSGPAQVWRTGQIESYYPGDDGENQAGVPWPDPRFTDNGDGTVRDNLTGLIWLKDAYCFGYASWENAFDMVAQWNENPDSCTCYEYTANYTWRLPNRKEYNSLTDFSGSQYHGGISLPPDHPFVNVFAFHNWTSTTCGDDHTKAWFKFLENGHMSGYDKAVVFPFFLVRSGLEVDIDVKPGSYPNCFNINGHGVIPVAVLGSEAFDVAKINISTLQFNGLNVRVKGNDCPQCSVEDVSGDFTSPGGVPDGYPDLICQFVDNPTLWIPESGSARLRGELLDGTTIHGEDEICLRPE